MRSSHEMIYYFLIGESDEGFEVIKNIFLKKVSSPSFHYLVNFESKEDLFSEFMIKVFNKREFLIELFKNQPKGLPSYIRKMASNFLKDKLRHMSKNTLNPVYKYKYMDELKREDLLSFDPVKILVILDCQNLEKTFDKQFSEDEKHLLYYLLEKDKPDFDPEIAKKFNDISRDAFYKRVQRLKEKLRRFVRENNFSEETIEYYLTNILPLKIGRGS